MTIEVRYDEERVIDEIVASDCTIHLERMGSDHWCLIIETAKTRGHFTMRRRLKTRVECEMIEVNQRRNQDNLRAEREAETNSAPRLCPRCQKNWISGDETCDCPERQS